MKRQILGSTYELTSTKSKKKCLKCDLVSIPDACMKAGPECVQQKDKIWKIAPDQSELSANVRYEYTAELQKQIREGSL